MAMVDNGKPYVVPMNFGYHDGVFYLHSGHTGKKMEILRKNPDVCLSLDIDSELNVRHENVACSYSMKYKSVIAHGKVEFVEDEQLKVEFMNLIMKHYCGRDDFQYSKPAISNVMIMIVKPVEICGHNRGVF
jgi:uncharacterized protein